jgi:excisionase family DNA binding protein
MVSGADYMLKKSFMDAIVEKYGLFLGVKDMCEILHISRPLVDQLIATRDLPAVRFGNRFRISADEFVNWYYTRAIGERKSVQSWLVAQQSKYPPDRRERPRVMER